jgi:hypothetical protein
MLTSVTLFAGSTFAQSQAARSDNRQKEVAATPVFRLSASEVTASTPNAGGPATDAAAEAPSSSSLESEVETLKTENAVVRELLHRMEEQQKALLEQVDRVQRRLEGVTSAVVQLSGQPQLAGAADPADRLREGVASAVVQPSGLPQATITDTADRLAADVANASGPATSLSDAPAQQAAADKPATDDRYQDGITIWENPEDARVPFLLKFNNNTQVRYLNTLDSADTFTDHLGVVREVHNRHDVTVNRSMFIFAGYMFDPKLQYSLTVWTSAGAASIVVAGNIGWRFNRGLTLTGGYTGVPGSRSLVATFPFFQSTDRSMADNFFRPGFTQGLWASGEPVNGLSYLAFMGNGLNTLNITANKIDTHLLFSGSVWWEPLAPYSEPGKSRNMYDDYFATDKTRIRIGTSLTRSREDRFSALDQTSPDNTSLYNSDGVLAFTTGAFAPGVTLQEATYKLWAFDGGLKKSGFSVNGQYFIRRLDDFDADGPLPLASTLDHGFELSAGYFIVPKKWVLYARGSRVFGQFIDPYEYAGGVKWYLLPTERLWLTSELMRVYRAPYSGAFTPYTAGMDGWVPMVQTVLAF